MEDLPDLPFEKVYSYLDLRDLLSSRAVSKKFYLKINLIPKFKVRSLCYSELKRGYILDKHRLVNGEFAENFVSSSRFDSFFLNLGRTILSDLRRLHVCDLDVEGRALQWIKSLNSFKNLEALGLFRISNLRGDFNLSLPKLKSIRLEFLEDDRWGEEFDLTLDAACLSEIWSPNLPHLNLVHAESVKSVLISSPRHLPGLKNLKNLNTLYCSIFATVSETLLSSLQQLRELHLDYDHCALRRLHEQKRRFGCSELKIFYGGLCLDSGEGVFSDLDLSAQFLRFVLANYSGLADQIRYHESISYLKIEEVIPQVPIDFWSRLTNLREIYIDKRIENVEQFLNFLDNFPRVRILVFQAGDQPQDLLDKLPLHCSPQIFRIGFVGGDLDVSCLLRLEDLVELNLWKFVDVPFIQRTLKQLQFVRYFVFGYRGKECSIIIDKLKQAPELTIEKELFGPFGGLDELIRFISEYSG